MPFHNKEAGMNKRTSRGFFKTDQVLEKLKQGSAGAIQIRTEAKNQT